MTCCHRQSVPRASGGVSGSVKQYSAISTDMAAARCIGGGRLIAIAPIVRPATIQPIVPNTRIMPNSFFGLVV